MCCLRCKSLWKRCICSRIILVSHGHGHCTPPTHLLGLLQVLGGYTEAVEGEVLHTRVDPLTSKGHHTKSPPLHLPDVNIQCKQSEVVDSGKDCWSPWGHTLTRHGCNAHMHMYTAEVWLARPSLKLCIHMHIIIIRN